MKLVTLSMTVNGCPFSQPADSIMAATQKIVSASRLAGCQVSNVTIKGERV